MRNEAIIKKYLTYREIMLKPKTPRHERFSQTPQFEAPFAMAELM
jgi:hypothetical protein